MFDVGSNGAKHSPSGYFPDPLGGPRDDLPAILQRDDVRRWARIWKGSTPPPGKPEQALFATTVSFNNIELVLKSAGTSWEGEPEVISKNGQES